MSFYSVPTKYLFWEGNIFRSQYSNQRGFWLVCKGRIAKRCDENGNLLTKEQCLYGTSEELTMKIDLAYRPYFLWRDTNEGTYPDVDAYNAEKRQDYIASEWTDEKAAPKFKAQDEERARSLAEYQALPPVEQWLKSFDWFYEESDAYDTARKAASSARRIFDVLDTMPEVEARALVGKYACHGESYDSLKRLMSFYKV